MSVTGNDLIAVHLHDGVGRIAQERKRQIAQGAPEHTDEGWAGLTTAGLVALGAEIAAEIDRRIALAHVARERHS